MSLALFGQTVATGHVSCSPSRSKPEVQVLRVNGKVRVIGVKEAAIYLGVSQTVVRDIAIGPAKSARYSLSLISRVTREYPQLQGGAHA